MSRIGLRPYVNSQWQRFLTTINYNKLTSEQVGNAYVKWLVTLPAKQIPPDYYYDYSGLKWWEKPIKVIFYISSKPKRSCPYLRLINWWFEIRYVFRRGYYMTRLPRS